MNLKKLIFSIVLVTLLIGCSDGDSDGEVEGSDGGNSDDAQATNLNEEADFPIVDEQITLDIFAGRAPASNNDWNDVLIFNEYEEMTNVDVNWEMVPVEGHY